MRHSDILEHSDSGPAVLETVGSEADHTDVASGEKVGSCAHSDQLERAVLVHLIGSPKSLSIGTLTQRGDRHPLEAGPFARSHQLAAQDPGSDLLGRRGGSQFDAIDHASLDDDRNFETNGRMVVVLEQRNTQDVLACEDRAPWIVGVPAERSGGPAADYAHAA